MKFQMLSASNSTDAKIWDSIVESFPLNRRDIHMTSAYGRVQERLGVTSWLAVHWDGDDIIVQPFIKRAIQEWPGYCDIASPYGYGGPISNIRDAFVLSEASIRSFHTALEVFSEAVCEFCYLNPLMLGHQILLLNDEAKYLKDVCVVDLQRIDWNLSRRIRRGIKTAREAGYRVQEVSKDPINADLFSKLYRASMERFKASSRWNFSDQYFDAHYRELGARLFMASNIVAEQSGARLLMVIGGYGTAYAHFLGSDGEQRDMGLDELLYYEVAQKLLNDGYERFHLGGGLTSAPDDKLLAFKKGFVASTLPMGSYKRVFNRAAYELLCDAKRKNEIATTGAEFKSGFFPMYRRDA